MRADLALDALQRVVDGLGIAREPLAHLLVGVAVEVQRQDPALELRQRCGQAPDERAQLTASLERLHELLVRDSPGEIQALASERIDL